MLRLLDRYVLFYPMRVVGATLLFVLTFLHAWHFDRFNAYHLALMGILAVHPHLVFYLVRTHAHARAKIEDRAFLVDAFLLGVVVHLLSFSLLPTLVLVTVALVNALAVNGVGQMLVSGAALTAGIVAPMLFLGVNLGPKDTFSIDLACSIFLFVYFHFFAFSAYNRSALLTQSQVDLEEQKATLEIEKMRSDRLLLNLVPAALAGELEREGHIEPRAYDPVTLLAIDFLTFSKMLEAWEPLEVMALLTHCFQGFDAIVARHGLEKLKTMGDLYLAVAGLPEPAEHDATATIRAALEVRDFLDDLAVERRAQGGCVLEARIGVHSGPVIGGLVRSAKLSYDLWGATVGELLGLQRHATPGQVVISEATRRLAGAGFSCADAGSLTARGKGRVALYSVEAEAA